jgi:aryl-alcohol dehydrogenase-like predicted oxidoreductase
VAVSVVSFGAGPVSGLMTGSDFAAQLATVAAALGAGVNWFDTAAGYGAGTSEANLGRVLAELRPEGVHVATKVRIPQKLRGSVGAFVRSSVAESLQRLQLSHVTLLQLHNGLTLQRNAEPASVTPDEALGEVLTAFQQLRRDGLVRHLGLTGTGEPAALRVVIRSGEFDTLQVPFNLLNPSAGQPGGAPDGEADHGNVIADCAAMTMGVFAIRVFAGGALLGNPPSAHTLTTPFFPLALYERDRERAKPLRGPDLAAHAVRFALAHPAVTSAIVGFGSPDHVREVVRAG